MINDTVEVPHRYIETGFHAILMLAIPGVLLMVMVGGLSASGFPDVGALSLSFLVGVIVSLVIFLVALIVIVLTINSIWRNHKHGIEIEDHIQALRESEAVRPLTMTIPHAATIPNLSVETTNQMNQDYKTALLIAEATIRELGKVADGEKLKGKPFSYDRCQKVGLVSRWEEWNRVIRLLEESGVGENLTDKSTWKFHVSNVHNVEKRLRDHYVNVLGLVMLNGNWTRM